MRLPSEKFERHVQFVALFVLGPRMKERAHTFVLMESSYEEL